MPDGNIMRYTQKNQDANWLMLVWIHWNGWGYTADHVGNSLQGSATVSYIFMG